MTLAVLFEVSGMTQEQYDAVIQKLKDSGASAPDGRLYHVAGPMEKGWRVVDVWESKEKLDAFMQNHLGKIMQEVGAPQPQVKPWQVHNIIRP